jgi:hypothetical protein
MFLTPCWAEVTAQSAPGPHRDPWSALSFPQPAVAVAPLALGAVFAVVAVVVVALAVAVAVVLAVSLVVTLAVAVVS